MRRNPNELTTLQHRIDEPSPPQGDPLPFQGGLDHQDVVGKSGPGETSIDMDAGGFEPLRPAHPRIIRHKMEEVLLSQVFRAPNMRSLLEIIRAAHGNDLIAEQSAHVESGAWPVGEQNAGVVIVVLDLDFAIPRHQVQLNQLLATQGRVLPTYVQREFEDFTEIARQADKRGVLTVIRPYLEALTANG